MKIRTLLVAAAAAAALTVGTAIPAQASGYKDPFLTSITGTFNHQKYNLSIDTASSSQVVRYGHNVNTTYKVRVTTGGKTVYSGTLGYYRTGYLHTKLTGTITRDYSLKTYIKKVTSFSSDYAKKQDDSLVRNYREKTLRSDVNTTVQNVNSYLVKHSDNPAGIENDNSVIVKTNGYFAYNEGDNLAINISFDPKYGKTDSNGIVNRVYYVTGIEKADLYQSVFDGNTGAIRSGHIDNVSNIN